jgi:hypothetical protein
MAPKVTVLGLQDMGELAVRLGSINTYDRKGDTIWMDDFEDNINKWGAALAGAGAARALSTDCARNGAKSAILTGGSDGARYAHIYRQLPFPVLSSLGYEFSFFPKSDMESVEFRMLLQDGADAWSCMLRFIDATKDVEIRVAGGGWVKVCDYFPFYILGSPFVSVKIVADFINSKYVKLLMRNRIIDLTAYNLYTYGDVVTPQVSVSVKFTSDVGKNGIMYIDDVIVTQNEP